MTKDEFLHWFASTPPKEQEVFDEIKAALIQSRNECPNVYEIIEKIDISARKIDNETHKNSLEQRCYAYD